VQLLYDPTSKITTYIQKKAVQRTVKDFYKGDHAKAQVIWILLALEVWMREVLHG